MVPSRSPGTSWTSAIEAGFSGLPVIATRRGGLPEVVEHETNGLLVEAQRPAELADALCRLIKDPQLRQHLASNARSCAIERFGRERFLGEFLCCWKQKNEKDIEPQPAVSEAFPFTPPRVFYR